ncbi:hypothetical protein FQA39_LY16683 [Lamprigera yunnana]|nr:hypothetical protein FQA39_LY16683 [Lamprigera yunnana]
MSYNTRRASSMSTNINKELVDESNDDDFSASSSEYEISSTEAISSSETTEQDITSSDSEGSFDVKNSRKLPLLLKQIGTGTNYFIKSDDYFANIGKKKSVTSDNTFTKFDAPKLQQEHLEKLLSQDIIIKHKKNLEDISLKNHEQFTKWMYVLKEGFNILVYGLGSKMTILQDFMTECLSNVPVVVVNGFFPNLSIKNVVDSIINDVLELSSSTASIYDACDLIAREMLQLRNISLYMIIHNIEGDMLKNNKAQTVLSKLATVKNIHLVASLDHVSAPLIWDNTKLSKFNFVWFDITNFQPYLKETSFEDSNLGIYLIIVKYQLENGKIQHYQGLPFKDLYWSCREAFLVSSDLALRSQLTEFVDHKMLKIKRSIDGAELILIPMTINILQQFYDEQSK